MEANKNLVGCEIDYAKIYATYSSKEIVDALLAGNRGNRPVSTRRVDMIARDIQQGGWKFNGATVVLDQYGTLRDGQHRLTAIRKAGYPRLPLLVVRLKGDVESAEAAYMTMDNGKSRSYTDNLMHEGVKSCTTVGAICRKIVYFNSGVQFPTRQELEGIRAEYADGIAFAIHIANRKSTSVVTFPSSALAALAKIAHDFGRKDEIERFVDCVADGIGLQPKTNAHSLFVYLSRTRGKGERTRNGLDIFATVAEHVLSELAGIRFSMRGKAEMSLRERVDAAIAAAATAFVKKAS